MSFPTVIDLLNPHECSILIERGERAMKSIYTYYKERLIEISGKNRSIYSKSFGKKTGYDIGRLIERDNIRRDSFAEFLWSGTREPFVILSPDMPSLGKLFGTEDMTAKLKAELDASEFSGKDERRKAEQKNARTVRQAFNEAYEKELGDIRLLQREAEEIEKETGRYELFVCYPFVYGTVRDVTFKAPLLFFPVEIEISDNVAELRLKRNESVRLNKALVYAYAQAKRLDIEDMTTEFDSLSGAGLGSVEAVLAYLRKFGIRIQPPEHRHIYNFKKFPEPKPHDAPAAVRTCMLARYSLANSVYNDYTELEKKKITNEAAEELLRPGKPKQNRKCSADKEHYVIADLDYAQRKVVEKVAANGNMVIYGPPGTGKSQTIVNLISDAVCKGKKVLVVSQKKAALDVVYNRLGELNEKAMFVVDPVKQRRTFYERCLARHKRVLEEEESEMLVGRHAEITELLAEETDKLEHISSAFGTVGSFGLSLLDMYYSSFVPKRTGFENTLYREMQTRDGIMDANFGELSLAVENLLGGKADIYYNYVETRKRNPFIQHLRRDISLDTLSIARGKLKELLKGRTAVFDEGSYPFARQILAHYADVSDPVYEKMLVKMLAAGKYKTSNGFLRTSKIVFPLYPFAKINMATKESEVERIYRETKKAIDKFVKGYEFLRGILDEGGYAMAINAVAEGNEAALSNLNEALTDYVKVRDLHFSLDNFSALEREILDLAYRITDNGDAFVTAVEKLIPIRIYHEIASREDSIKADLSLTVEFESIKSRISALLAEQKELAKKICAQSFVEEYKKMFAHGHGSMDYLYTISKKQSFSPIRKTMEMYGDYLLTLFPCWLLSPENVSSILPLKKNIFDLVLFDEASQVFIENTLPSVIRGRNIVVAGDAKQLRPTATFMRRYMGSSDDEDPSVQAALEVESLLDLAVARFDSANITYHYRSTSRELIDFSNKAFYDDNLMISPNSSRSVKSKPIVRIKTDGMWSDRKNAVEARETVSLLRKLLRNGKGKDTVGIITFGNEQQNCIEDMIDKECRNDPDFRALIARESSRKENGQDVGLFVKNIENVQGDERDIIIFCIGYARNENGKVNVHFGSLSSDGGENRLNVAITRAKKKVYVITSIEPEELKVDGTKNNGPKLFRSYLEYVRAVSSGNKEEADILLRSLCPDAECDIKPFTVPVEKQIADKLNLLGYKTEINLGEGLNRISVAVYDKRSDKYVLGIQLDRSVMNGKSTALERDVFAYRFLTQRGWKIMRVWSRDWWHDPNGVISDIVNVLGDTPKETPEHKKTVTKTD